MDKMCQTDWHTESWKDAMSKKFVLITATVLLQSAMTASTATTFPPLVLSGIVDRGTSGDTHAFELYGSFPGGEFIRPIVSCDGKRMVAEVMAAPVSTQINVGV
jgi:hypothetical protein